MFKKLPKPFRNFYFLTAFFFLLWMIALDSNNFFTRFELSSKLRSLENEKIYYEDKIKEVEKDRDELFGDNESLEKFAREKYLMKKETEDIFIVEEKRLIIMKKLTLVVVFSMLGTLAFAQWGDEQLSDEPKWQERVFTGGGIGASFGSYYDYISVSPLVGYRITQKLAGGFQFQYRYTHYKSYTPDFSTNDFGVSPFLRFSIFGPFFLHAEYEYLSYQYPISAQGDKARKGYDSFMAGGGFFQPVGRRAGIYAVALYNFSYKDPTSSNDFYPYNSPVVLRVGITAGF